MVSKECGVKLGISLPSCQISEAFLELPSQGREGMSAAVGRVTTAFQEKRLATLRTLLEIHLKKMIQSLEIRDKDGHHPAMHSRRKRGACGQPQVRVFPAPQTWKQAWRVLCAQGHCAAQAPLCSIFGDDTPWGMSGSNTCGDSTTHHQSPDSGWGSSAAQLSAWR